MTATPKVREALEAIRIRCRDGDKRTNWLPIIDSIASEALSLLDQPVARGMPDDVRVLLKEVEHDVYGHVDWIAHNPNTVKVKLRRLAAALRAAYQGSPDA